MWGTKSPNRVVMQFCTGVDVRDLITPANFCSHRFRRFWIAGVEFQAFPLTFNVVLITSGTTVLACDYLSHLLANFSFKATQTLICIPASGFDSHVMDTSSTWLQSFSPQSLRLQSTSDSSVPLQSKSSIHIFFLPGLNIPRGTTDPFRLRTTVFELILDIRSVLFNQHIYCLLTKLNHILK